MGSAAADRPVVIVLNGVSSVGKSSTAKAIQELAERPFLHVSMDAFLEMLPARVLGAGDGIIFQASWTEGFPTVEVRTGAIVERALSGMRHAVAALAAQGNHLIVDDVFWGDEANDYKALLADCHLRFVGLTAPLELVERRERERGDRDIGLARWQHERVHQGVAYDLMVDAAYLDARGRARLICDTFGL